jgi:hypothetical protein
VPLANSFRSNSIIHLDVPVDLLPISFFFLCTVNLGPMECNLLSNKHCLRSDDARRLYEINCVACNREVTEKQIRALRNVMVHS